MAVAAAVRTFGTRQAAIDHLLASAATEDQNANDILHNNQGEDGNANNPITDQQSENGSGANTGSSSAGGPSHNKVEERDVEMEDAITGELLRGDAYSDYDIEVTEEGEAINEYLALVTIGDNVENRPSS